MSEKNLTEWRDDILKNILQEYSDKNQSTLYEYDWLNAVSISEAISKRGVRTVEPRLQEANVALDKNYLIQKLKLASSAINFSNINDYEYDLGILKLLEDYLVDTISEEDTLLYLYYQTYLMVKDKEVVHFENIFKYLKENKIPRNEDFQEIFKMCINFCIQSINKGKRAFIHTLYEIYQLEIKSGNIYDERGALSPNTYKNITNISLHLKEYKWTEGFIESEMSKLPKLNRQEHYQFAKARLFFETEKYRACVFLIMQSKPQDLLNNLSMRVLLCKSLYELADYDQVDSEIHNAKLYLLRHKNKAYQLKIYRNFFRILLKIIKYKSTKASRENIQVQFEKTKSIADKQWLKEKIMSL